MKIYMLFVPIFSKMQAVSMLLWSGPPANRRGVFGDGCPCLSIVPETPTPYL